MWAVSVLDLVTLPKASAVFRIMSATCFAQTSIPSSDRCIVSAQIKRSMSAATVDYRSFIMIPFSKNFGTIISLYRLISEFLL